MSALNYKKTSADRSGSLFAIVDERISEICEASLFKMGFEIIKLPKDERLGEAVASHTDMILFRYENTLIGSREYFSRHKEVFKKIKDALAHFEFILTSEELCRDYPFDAIFNALKVGNKLFAKTDTAARAVLELAKSRGLEIIGVKQGYPACTTLAVSSDLAITADKGMARALKENGISVLEIFESEKIKLPPYKNGFIGGAAGVLDSKVYFLGNLLSHPSGEAIKTALKMRGYEVISLDPSADALFDLGGMILIKTERNGRSINPKKPKSE